MGVPKFYRWISERYPCLSEVVKEFQIPEFDNLYLDMNGIIHVCSHPEDDNPHFRITEEKIFSDVMYYIAFLFRMIKPRKVFFMAVDGVAPRAKMNQQRGRRFRSAREAEELERRAQLQGETLPTEKRFDSNCITPGTPFMVRLQEQLKYFVVQKISSDPLWQGVRVYLSGHETPGEGEHKIMDFIRAERARSDYDPNTRHCLYGLDADLMMLGLATHEPHFSLLREEVRFGRKGRHDKRPVTPEETTFHLLHLSLFREYLNFEFSPLKEKLTTFAYDLESVIDDWVLMGFLVGNDFIPHLPNLHINHDALPLLWQTYMEVLPSGGGYINNGGHLNLERFEAYLKVLSKFDFDTFSEQAGDLKWLESKKAGSSAAKSEVMRAAKRILNNQKKTAVDISNQFSMLNQLNNDDMPECEELGIDLVDSPLEEYSEEASEDISEEDTLDDEFRHHKRNYYMTKMEYENVTPTVLRDQAEGYVRGIQWILLYYYEGVPSWGWFYPHHYAPYMSDVKDFKDMNIQFDIGTPFMPFEQLMAVLPAASKELLPKPFQDLMINDSSPVKDFYPPEFETDLNGKQQDWEAVVLIPFIQENRLLAAMRSVEHLMTAEEKSRNHHGPHLLYEYTSVVLEPYHSTMPSHFPDVIPNHAQLTKVHQDAFHINTDLLKKGVLEGVKLDVYFPGFPTLKNIPHTHELSKEGVKVFQSSSRGYNMMLHIIPQDIPDIDHIAKEYLGKEIFVNWPHMYEAKVVEVNNGKVSVLHEDVSNIDRKSSGLSQPRKETVDEMAFSVWQKEVASLKERYLSRLGVMIGDTEVILKALPMTGRKYIFGSHGRVTMEKQFGIRPVPFALQATVKDIAVHDPDFNQFKTLDEYLPNGALVFMLGWPHYGSQGEVLDTDAETGRVRINLTIFEEPQLSSIVNNLQFHDEQYYEGYVISQRLGINSNLLSRITGTIFVCAGEEVVTSQQLNPHKVNIGLNLKFTKREEEIPGYTRLKEGKWMYSMKTTEIVKQYMNKFPEMFEMISRSDRKHNDVYYESQVIPKGCNYTLKAVEEFIKSLPCRGLKSLKSGSDIVSEGVIKALQDQASKITEINKKKKKLVKLQVKPHLVFKTMQNNTSLIPDSSTTYILFDRVVNIRLGFSVPFGLRGTVVGIYPSEVEVNTMYEVIFDEDFTGGISIRSSSNRGYRMAPSALLNLTHGERKNGVTSISRSQLDVKPGSYHGDQYRNDNINVSHADVTGIKGYNSQDSSYRQDPYGFKRNMAALQGYQGSSVYNSAGNMEWERQKQVAHRSPNDQQYQPHQQRYDKSWTDANTAMNYQKQAAVEIPPGKVFNGANAGTSPPTFVTPRVAQNTKQPMNRGMPINQTLMDRGNSEFENMWKQLQSSVFTPPLTILDKKTSLTQAPTVTDDRTKPMQAPASTCDRTIPTQPSPVTVDRTIPTQPSPVTVDRTIPTQPSPVTVDRTIPTQPSPVTVDRTIPTQPSPVTDDRASLTQATTVQGNAMALTQATQLGALSAGTTKIDVQSLFFQASISNNHNASALTTQPETTEAKSKASVSHVVSSDEFAAMFKSLEAVHLSNEANDKVAKNKLEDVEDCSIVMKKRMDKGTDENTELPSESTKSYGRQVSLQELFEGAKMQQEPTVTSIKENQEPQQQQVQAQQTSNQGQGQHSHQVQQLQQDINKRPAVSMPQSRGGNRNPVMELMDFCQSLHMGLPLYDYIPKQGKHYCVVSLFNGAKFQGSVFKTKEEAAESAASAALVQLKGSMQQLASHPIMPVQGCMPRIMPNWQQFSSPNSAFSPVSFTPGFYQGQPIQGSRQYYPSYQYQIPYGVGQSQQQYNVHVNTRQPSTHSIISPNVGRHQPLPHGAPGSLPYQCVDNRMAVNHSADNKMVDKPSSANLKASKEGKIQPTCVVSPFVPMQVMRKQTPQKYRKNSASEEVSKAEALETPKVDHSTGLAAKEDNPMVVEKMVVDKKLNDTNEIAPESDNKNSSSISVEHKTVAKSDSSPHQDNKSDNKLNNKPPKRRIAAKFTYDP